MKTKNYDALLLNISKFIDPYLQNEIPMADLAGLDMLAAYAGEKGFLVKVGDFLAHEALLVLEQELAAHSVKIAGFYCDFVNLREVAGLSRFIKKQYGLTVIIGGPQAAFLNKEYLAESLADVIVIGEGEETFAELLDYFLRDRRELSLIRGIAYLDNENFVKTAPRPLVADLDTLPFPNPLNRLKNQRRLTFKSVMTGRGCPFSCAFCFEGNNAKTVRYRSVENVMAEIKTYLQNLNPGQKSLIYFTDDTFTLDIQRVRDFCRELKKLRETYDFVWYCEGHVRLIARHLDIIETMLDAGLIRLQIGVESGVQTILDCYNKQVTLEEIETVIETCARLAVPQVYCNLIVGGAFESQETITQSTEFALKLLEKGKGMLGIGTPYFTPYPNTDMTNNPAKYGIKIVDSQKETAFSSNDYPLVETDFLSRDEIHGLKLDMVNKINKKMRSLKESVNFQQVFNCYKTFLIYGKQSEWFGVFSTEEHKRMYFTRLVMASQMIVRLENKPLAEVLPLIPLRTVNLPELKNEGFSIHNYNLSELETQLLLYSAGTLTIKEIIYRLYPVYGRGIAAEQFDLKIMEILQSFERRYWLNFSLGFDFEGGISNCLTKYY
jgi:radical SAM superfamily enzyme YgiQ (UPF0313 family)